MDMHILSLATRHISKVNSLASSPMSGMSLLCFSRWCSMHCNAGRSWKPACSCSSSLPYSNSHQAAALLHRCTSAQSHLQCMNVKDDDACGAAPAGWDVGQDARQCKGSGHITFSLNLQQRQQQLRQDSSHVRFPQPHTPICNHCVNTCRWCQAHRAAMGPAAMKHQQPRTQPGTAKSRHQQVSASVSCFLRPAHPLRGCSCAVA